MRAKTMHNKIKVVPYIDIPLLTSACRALSTFYALIPFIEHFLKQRRSIY